MGAALALGSRGVGRTSPNPPVGCVVVNDGRVVGRGWTQPGGRPHAEQMALAEAGSAARGATVYTTLEPCAHVSPRGPACSDGLTAAGVARVVAALIDPDPRTAGQGAERLRGHGIDLTLGVRAVDAEAAMAGFLSRVRRGRPFVTLKLALSLDGRIAMANGESQWITGAAARAHAHLLRAQSDMILVGRGTMAADDPALDVRLPGLEDRSPRPAVLSATGAAIPPNAKLAARGAIVVRSVAEALTVDGVNDLLVEGGAGAAAAFLAADAVDRLVIYRAPILVGEGRPALADIGLARLADAHGRWRPGDSRMLGPDRLETYNRIATATGSG
ncbi:MAG: bifunctional diaminohydroxyphosphoribosylaminopyrimidine deaminase/5-amino-6-(5-phosphoribosylamino)uracil reductase RibD [Alphaproteobacteria bacterium]|nr:bifunctional diaminohydroxyphosphoribosylaminopyrimidine deaminase/5-amino-6-(5-phosphoribosylamino)uracil reductase RibD [Alphaproteobacteria bacterium]